MKIGKTQVKMQIAAELDYLTGQGNKSREVSKQGDTM